MQKTLYVVGGGDLSDYIACKRGGGGGCQAAVVVNTHNAETDISTNRVCLWKRSIEHGSSLSTPLQRTQIAVFIVRFKIILAMSVVPISKYAHFSLFLCVSLFIHWYWIIDLIHVILSPKPSFVWLLAHHVELIVLIEPDLKFINKNLCRFVSVKKTALTQTNYGNVFLFFWLLNRIKIEWIMHYLIHLIICLCMYSFVYI